jgi:hypothetical protein
MKSTLTALATTAVLAMGLSMPAAHGQGGFENEAVLQASGLVGPDLFAARGWTVQESFSIGAER